MNPYMTDEEKAILVKRWCREYGATIVTTILLVIIFSFAWKWWQHREERIRSQASNLYEQMIMSAETHDSESVTARANSLQTTYAKTPYSQLAGLMLARQAVEKNDLPKAEQQLNWVVQVSRNKTIRQVARIRLARVLNAEKKSQQALDLLKVVEVAEFAPYVAQVRGDIYLGLGEKDKARESYLAAMSALPAANRTLLQMKVDELVEHGVNV